MIDGVAGPGRPSGHQRHRQRAQVEPGRTATIEVSSATGRSTVRDHGPGFAEGDLPHVFDRFYRAEDARRMPGSGLGLAIVKQAAEAGGGSVGAANAPERGAVVTVSFA